MRPEHQERTQSSPHCQYCAYLNRLFVIFNFRCNCSIGTLSRMTSNLLACSAPLSQAQSTPLFSQPFIHWPASRSPRSSASDIAFPAFGADSSSPSSCGFLFPSSHPLTVPCLSLFLHLPHLGDFSETAFTTVTRDFVWTSELLSYWATLAFLFPTAPYLHHHPIILLLLLRKSAL